MQKPPSRNVKYRGLDAVVATGYVSALRQWRKLTLALFLLVEVARRLPDWQKVLWFLSRASCSRRRDNCRYKVWRNMSAARQRWLRCQSRAPITHIYLNYCTGYMISFVWAQNEHKIPYTWQNDKTYPYMVRRFSYSHPIEMSLTLMRLLAVPLLLKSKSIYSQYTL